MMFRRRSKKGSANDLYIDSSNHSINNSRHKAKYNLSQSLPELRRSQSLVIPPKPIKGILRITSVEDSLQSVYGKDDDGRVQSTNRRINSCTPDFDTSVRSSQSDDIVIRHGGSTRRRQSVLFKAIEIREYERTVGDNPSCSSGPPVAISWDYDPQVKKLPLDDYENYRPNRRSSYEMILSREIRDRMLRTEWDVSRAEIAAAIRETIKIKNQRRQTVQNLSKDKVEEMFENASKKIFRSLMFKSSTTQELDMLNRQYMAVQELRKQELQLVQEGEAQPPFGNGTSRGSSSDTDQCAANGVGIVGLTIDDDDEIVEDINDNDDEHKEDLPSAATVGTTNKKPIMIVERDDDTAMLMNVESFSTRIESEQQQQRQYKGENSSEDGSTNLNSSHHKVVGEHIQSLTSTATTLIMGNITSGTTTEI